MLINDHYFNQSNTIIINYDFINYDYDANDAILMIITLIKKIP